MFDNLLKLVKENAGDAIIKNPVIPNEKNDEAIHATTTSIFDTLKNLLASGNTDSLTNLFKGQNNSSTVNNSIQNNVVETLMKKFGIDNSQANNITSTLIPKVMDSFVKRTNDPNDKSFDLSDIMRSLTNGNTSGILNKISSFFK